MRMNRRRKSARISVQERLKTPGKPCAYQPRRHSGLLEQTVAHGAAGRAVSEINTVRRGPVNGGVRLFEIPVRLSVNLVWYNGMGGHPAISYAGDFLLLDGYNSYG